MLFATARKLVKLSGEALVGGDGKEMTLGSVASEVLVAVLEDAHVGQAEKGRRFMLAVRIADNPAPAIDITTEDATLLKRLVDKAYPSPLVSGQFANLVENPETPATAAEAALPTIN